MFSPCTTVYVPLRSRYVGEGVGAGVGEGVGTGVGEGVTRLALPANMKLRPKGWFVGSPIALNVSVYSFKSLNSTVTARSCCSSVNSSGSEGLSAPVPVSDEVKVNPDSVLPLLTNSEVDVNQY